MLQQTLTSAILILQTRLSNLSPQSEQPQSEQKPIPCIHQTSSIHNLSRQLEVLQGIHDRVSAYVLLKVEKQIQFEKLIDLDSDVNKPDYSTQTVSENLLVNETTYNSYERIVSGDNHLRNEFHFSGVHGAMNRSGSRAK